MNVAFLGLGVMGYPMAGHLQKAGHNVVVYNRTASKASEWASEFGGEVAHTPCDAASRAEVVFACVGNDDDVRAVTVGESGAFSGMSEGTIFVDHTTASANLARELGSEAVKRGLKFVDAPVSGGQAGAENGALTVMCGGDQVSFKRIEPVIDAYARAAVLLGPVGSGQLTKMVNQICIAGVVQGLAEAVHFSRLAGLDGEQVFPLLAQGAAGSWQMENRYSTMLKGEYEFGFAVDWMRKDLAIVLDEARQNGAHLPVAALVDQFYSEVQALGGNRWDTSSLLARLRTSRQETDESST